MKTTSTTHSLAADLKAGSQDACAVETWREAAVAVVADGVGGAEGGREAAERVVKFIVSNFKSRPKSWSAARALEEFTQLINRTLHQESMAQSGRAELLTTIAAVVLEGDQVCGLNVGDSRVYLWRAGKLQLLTQDHVQNETGFRHVLQQAVGLAPEILPHKFSAQILPGDKIVLCSDGLWNVLPEENFLAALEKNSSARTLVSAARELATEETIDDTTAVVIEVIEASANRNQSLEVPGPLLAGQIYDGCTLIRPLNQTERAWIGTRDGRELVVKFAPERARDDEAIHNQFAKEIWSVTRFESDFFIHAFVPADSRTFCYCMEYLPWPTLKDVLLKGRLSVPEAVALANFLLDAAQFFAGHDLVHGDIKPENILVRRDGEKIRFKLIDFGSVTEFFSITSRAGTPSFVAPERFHSAPISERTEIFSIGVTLFLALTGKFPYGEIEPFQTPVFRAPLRLTKLDAHIPPWLESVALRAVAVTPEERYEMYSELKFDLDNPGKVRAWFRKDTPLLDRDPLLFYKTGFYLLLITCLILLVALLGRR